MDFESLKKLAQNALETEKDVAGKATASTVESVRSVAPESFDNIVKSVTDTVSTVAGRVTEKTTDAVEALRETPLGQSIVEGANTLAETAVSAGGRIARAAWKKECGACHMAFQPELLPARSWTALMAGLDNHFGENASLDAATSQAILAYLQAHAADVGGGYGHHHNHALRGLSSSG